MSELREHHPIGQIFVSPPPLPHGPHAFPAATVQSSQRMRLMKAMTQLVAENGYQETTVVDLLRRAGISRTTFYQLFSDKQSCWLATFDYWSTVLIERIAAVSEHSVTWDACAENMIDNYIDSLEADRTVATAMVVSASSAGSATQLRSQVAYRAAAAVLRARYDAARAADASLGPIPDRIFAGMFYALHALVYADLSQSPDADLSGIRDEMKQWLRATALGYKAS